MNSACGCIWADPTGKRLSFDAVVVVAAVLALIAYGSTIRRWHPKHHITVVLLVLALAAFGFALYHSMQWAYTTFGPILNDLESQGPT